MEKNDQNQNSQSIKENYRENLKTPQKTSKDKILSQLSEQGSKSGLEQEEILAEKEKETKELE